jgi:NAD+ synthase
MKLILDEKALDKCKEKIEGSIRAIVKESDSRGCILGLSGGIDSSLVLSLAASSGIDVHALIMPENGVSSEEDVRDAVDLARSLNVSCSTIRINPILDSIDKVFPWEEFRQNEKKTCFGNAKARVRMTLNYLAANMERRIVLGTGNKTEILLGYSTKYGDGGVDIQPVGDLYKSQIRQLARHVGVPERILAKVPSAGLWPGQTDEGEIGASYGDMDRILYFLVDEGLSIKETSKRMGATPAEVEKIRLMMKRNSHKREMPKVTKLF